MKTKIKIEEIDQEHQESRMTYIDYQKMFVKDFGRLAENEPVRGFILTTFDFKDKTRPLFVLGTHMEWKTYLKGKIRKKEKEFVVVEATFKPGKPHGTLHIELVTGKAKPTLINKAFKKHPPMDGVEFLIGHGEVEVAEENTEELDNLLKDDKDGFKLGFGKSDFAKIKEQIGALKDIHDSEEKKKALEELIPLCKNWLVKHKNPSKDDVQRFAHVQAIIPKLELMLNNLLKELNNVGDDDSEYLLGLFKEIVVEHKNYVKERPNVPNDEQLKDLHSLTDDCNTWLSKHAGSELTAKEKKEKAIVTKVKSDVEKRIQWLNAQLELGDEFEKWKAILKTKTDLDSIPEREYVKRLRAIDELEGRMAALTKKLK